MTLDLTAFTEVDPNGHISKTSSRVTLASLDTDEDAYLYKDYGASYFDAIELYFAGRCSSSSDYEAFGICGLANQVDDAYGWSSPFIRAYFFINGGDLNFWLETATGGWDKSVDLNYDQTYYFKMVRAAGNNTVTLYVYSDAARTVLVDTLSRTGLGTTKFRYLYAASSVNDDFSGYDFDGYYENFEIIGKLGGQVRFIGMMM